MKIFNIGCHVIRSGFLQKSFWLYCMERVRGARVHRGRTVGSYCSGSGRRDGSLHMVVSVETERNG